MGYWDSLGKSDEWYTPPHVFGALGCVFDMDVAAPANSATHVPARAFITADSLRSQWTGFVWMNPPFGGRNGLEPWMKKFFEHADGIALTPDRTSAPWFREAWLFADMVLFTPKLRFLRPDGSEGKSPSNGTALWAKGQRAVDALCRARDAGLGIAALPLRD
ncbi:DNA N-6-adenine-methyltransferase [Rhizobium sp. GCM10022189]|uniref:DNA N-6-adenine-methyltransferase n=1 Tax=Rhizobium sp. GCM10022189 TaxID=3252654 RepID=UPI00360733C7